jgi:hypothetical protein
VAGAKLVWEDKNAVADEVTFAITDPCEIVGYSPMSSLAS